MNLSRKLRKVWPELGRGSASPRARLPHRDLGVSHKQRFCGWLRGARGAHLEEVLVCAAQAWSPGSCWCCGRSRGPKAWNPPPTAPRYLLPPPCPHSLCWVSSTWLGPGAHCLERAGATGLSTGVMHPHPRPCCSQPPLPLGAGTFPRCWCAGWPAGGSSSPRVALALARGPGALRLSRGWKARPLGRCLGVSAQA